MPHRHTIRFFIENGLYHVYNRGVEKRNIFLDEQDYSVFLHLLKYYLSPVDDKTAHPLLEFQKFSVVKPKPLSNIGEEIELLAYCLMPNHFHLLVRQISKDGMTKLLRRISTTYSMYFNKRYKRVGYLFQGRYKAAFIDSDNYLIHVSRYIHLNPLDLLKRSNLFNYPYSSYPNFVGTKRAIWLKPEFILKYFDTSKMLPFLNKYPSYKEFVESYPQDSKEILGKLTID